MKTITALFLAVAACGAATIQFGSGMGSPEGNSLPGSNVPTLTASAWHQALLNSVWESIQPDSLNPPISDGTRIDFWIDVTVPAPAISSQLQVLVDDSGAISVNGHLITSNLGSAQGVHCAATLPNCITPLSMDITQWLVVGTNRVDVVVSQDGDGQYGFDLAGTVTTAGTTANPEPGTWLLVGGVLLIGVGRLRCG